MKCPNCGTENENRNVCIKCGKFIQGKKLRRYDQSPQEKRRNFVRKLGLTTRSCLVTSLLMVAALIVISVLFILVFRLLSRFIDFPDMPTPLTDDSGSYVTDPSGNYVYPTNELSESIDISSDSSSPSN